VDAGAANPNFARRRRALDALRCHRVSGALAGVAGASHGVIVLFADGREAAMNAHARVLFGDAASLDPARLPLRDLDDGALLAPDAHPIARARRGESFHALAVVARTADGDDLVLLVSACPIASSDHARGDVVLVFETAGAARRLAHDLNDALTVVLTHAALIAPTFASADARREDIQQVLRGAERAATLVRALAPGGRAGAPSPASAAPALPPISVLVVDDDAHVRAAMARVLRAAGANAVAVATPAEARLALGADDPIDLLVVDVLLGDGRGDVLARELVAREPGLRVVLTSGDAVGASARADAGWQVLGKPFLASELCQAALAVLPSPERGGASARADLDAGSRVLIVEDEPAIRRVIARAARKAGFVAVEAASIGEALSVVAAVAIDVVVSDVNMPGNGGIELLRELRRRGLEIPVILITGSPDVRTSAIAIEHGVFRYLIKPIEIRALVDTLRIAVRGRSLDRLQRAAGHGGALPDLESAERTALEARFDHAMDRLWLALSPIAHARSGEIFGLDATLRSDDDALRTTELLDAAALQLDRLRDLSRRARSRVASLLPTRGRGRTIFVTTQLEDLLDIELATEHGPLASVASQVVLQVAPTTRVPAWYELADRVAELRARGLRLAVRLGGGNAGLAMFTELRPELVKIDVQLVRDVHASVLKQRTLRALCELCHEIGAQVVAEDVDSPAERDCLVDLGCDLLQGPLVGPPTRDPDLYPAAGG
jgi:DNA-binding response OmpR family regulator